MGSNAEEFPHQDDEINVLVTGFGPFRLQNPVNPSWEIARSLPPFLPPPKENTTSTSKSNISTLASHCHPVVCIKIHPEAVRVAYKTVRPLVPKLWEGQDDQGGRKIDYMIHIGMASGRNYYSVERRGHRDGYAMRDVDGELLGDAERRVKEGKDWVWDGLPEELLSSTDIDAVWRRWRTALPSTDIRISEDAGRYLCDFMYFSSLAYLEKKGEEKRVVFLHVPVEADDAAVETGVQVTLELIRALVQSGRMKKEGDRQSMN